MKKVTKGLMLVLFVLSLTIGCGQKADTPADDMAAGTPEEVADTTRLDSAAVPVTTDTMAAPVEPTDEGGE